MERQFKINSEDVSEVVLIASLEHVRAKALHYAEVRMKNFNFFLILIGALAAVVTSSKVPGMNQVLSLFGSLLSCLFFALDVRGVRLLDGARKEIRRLEPKFGLDFSQRDFCVTKRPLLSHTYIYRGIYSLFATMSLVMFCWVSANI